MMADGSPAPIVASALSSRSVFATRVRRELYQLQGEGQALVITAVSSKNMIAASSGKEIAKIVSGLQCVTSAMGCYSVELVCWGLAEGGAVP